VLCIFHIGESDLKTQGFHVLRVEEAPPEPEEEVHLLQSTTEHHKALTNVPDNPCVMYDGPLI
jgi:hypothetical protein